MLKFLGENWSMIIDILLVLVGLSAFIVYCAQKRTALFSAGTLIIGQIMLVEKNISSLKENNQLGNVAVYHSKPIIKENMWEQYKHLFAKRLTGAEYEAVQQFFDHAEQLERARLDIISTIMNSWKDMSSVEHQVIAQLIREDLSETEMTSVCGKIRALDLVFTPGIAIDGLTKRLETFSALTGTTSYAKIQKRSYTK